MNDNYYTLTADFLGRHKSKIASVIYYPDKKAEHPVGFTYEFMPREKVGQYTIDSLMAIFDSLVKTAPFAGISEDKKRYQIVSAFALYNATYGASNPIFKAPPVPLPRADDANVQALKIALNSAYGLPGDAPTFTARKVGTMHYFPDAKKVIFKGPATIVLWADKTKTVVKCMDGDTYDPEKAVLMAYLEKLAGGKGPAKRFLKDCLKDYTPQVGAVNDAETQELTTAEKVRLVRELLKTMTCSEAAKALGISESTVRRVRRKPKEDAE